MGRRSVRTTSVLDTGLTAGTEYCYVVQAVNFGGGSGFSTEVCGVPEVQTNWTAFIDLRSSDGDQNAPNVLEIAEGTAGTPINPLTVFDLIDIDSGATVGATLQVDNSGIDVSSDDGGPFTAGPAFDVFDGIVDPAGVYGFSDSDDVWQLNFAGLNLSMRYEIVLSTNAATPASPEAWTDVSLGSAPYSVEASGGSTTVVTATQVQFESEDNTIRGDVARWITINPGDDGTFTVDANLFVPAGVTGSFAPVAVMLREFTPSDVTAPVLTVDVPLNHAVGSSPVLIAGSASDAVGVDVVRLEIKDREEGLWWNGSGWQTDRVKFEAELDPPVGEETGWSYSFTPLGGPSLLPYWMTAIAFDAAGNASNRDTRYFSVDSGDEVAPVLTVDVPLNHAVGSSPVLIAGSASDAVGVDVVRLEIKDREEGLWWNGSGWQTDRVKFEAELDPPVGEETGWSYSFTPLGGPSLLPYWMTAIAFDAAGNASNRDTRYFSVDSGDEVAPVLTVDVPLNHAVGSSPVLIAGSASDAVGVDVVRLEIKDREEGLWWNGSGWQTDRVKFEAELDPPVGEETGWSYSFTPLGGPSLLPYWMTAIAFDAAGNASNRDIRYFTIEEGAPQAPFESDDFNAASLDPRWTFVDPLSGTAPGSFAIVGNGSGDAHIALDGTGRHGARCLGSDERHGQGNAGGHRHGLHAGGEVRLGSR